MHKRTKLSARNTDLIDMNKKSEPSANRLKVRISHVWSDCLKRQENALIERRDVVK